MSDLIIIKGALVGNCTIAEKNILTSEKSNGKLHTHAVHLLNSMMVQYEDDETRKDVIGKSDFCSSTGRQDIINRKNVS
jgi:hypothetical protein